ncbi:MAG TPA: hypothetical protein VEC38_15205 [Candidatus Binataceae bacterium]|nr:hypothetical protein [Candidatus Binataceae bacterium]
MNPVQIRAGKAVYLPWRLTTGQPAAAFDPPSAPLISIRDPNGITQVNSQPTIQAESGLYYYVYVTPSAGPAGDWVAWLDVIDQNDVPSGSLRLVAFELVP